MSEGGDRRPAVLLALALLFVAGMGALYVWSTRPAPPAPLAAAPGAKVLAPTVVPEVQSRPAPRKAPRPSRPAITPPAPTYDEEPEETTPRDPLAPAEFDIRVVDDGGNDLSRVLVRATSASERPQRLVTDSKGRVSARLKAGEVVFVAERADGMLVSQSEPVTVDASDGGAWDVELVISSEPKAGLGVGIQPHAEGVRVTLVHDGTPAAEAGLTAGDVIVAVEGEETAGMPLPDFIARMTGPVGTKVLFDIVREDGSEERMQVRRALIERPGQGGGD